MNDQPDDKAAEPEQAGQLVSARVAPPRRERASSRDVSKSVSMSDVRALRRGGRENEKGAVSGAFRSGACRDRTGDLRLAKPALSQLS